MLTSQSVVQMRQGSDRLASLDADAIRPWLGDFYRQRPEDTLSVALIRLVLAASR